LVLARCGLSEGALFGGYSKGIVRGKAEWSEGAVGCGIGPVGVFLEKGELVGIAVEAVNDSSGVCDFTGAEILGVP